MNLVDWRRYFDMYYASSEANSSTGSVILHGSYNTAPITEAMHMTAARDSLFTELVMQPYCQPGWLERLHEVVREECMEPWFADMPCGELGIEKDDSGDSDMSVDELLFGEDGVM